MRGVCGEGRDRRLALLLLHTRAEIKPVLKLAGVATSRRRASADDEKLDRHLFDRKIVGQVA